MTVNLKSNFYVRPVNIFPFFDTLNVFEDVCLVQFLCNVLEVTCRLHSAIHIQSTTRFLEYKDDS